MELRGFSSGITAEERDFGRPVFGNFWINTSGNDLILEFIDYIGSV